jgi:hypothetical protein
MWEGSGCQANEDAKLMHNLGYGDAAIKSRLCERASYRDAFAYAGQPCENDSRKTQWEAAWRAQGYHQRADGYWIR